jgi:hypothetical protein
LIRHPVLIPIKKALTDFQRQVWIGLISPFLSLDQGGPPVSPLLGWRANRNIRGVIPLKNFQKKFLIN